MAAANKQLTGIYYETGGPRRAVEISLVYRLVRIGWFVICMELVK
jgi:hypothetical protein